MATFTLTVNGREQTVEAEPGMPLLWVLRDILGLTGTKYGCGQALCGACTVHLDGRSVRSCETEIQDAAGGSVLTIEGLHEDGDHPLQIAWKELDVPQCGYCQPGQIMNAAGFLAQNPTPDRDAVDQAMRGNLCRCGTYNRIRAAILDVAAGNGENTA
jgi:isoquinoline 1-oxidoreductase alpha subunit